MANLELKGFRMDKANELDTMKEIDKATGQHRRPDSKEQATTEAALIEALAENQPATRIRSVEDKLDKITEQLNTIIMLMKHPAQVYETPEDNARRMHNKFKNIQDG